MAEDRIDSIIDIKAVKAELDSTKTGINELVALIQSVKGKAVEITGAKSVSELKGLSKELDLLIKQTNLSAKAAIDEAKARDLNAKAALNEAKAADAAAKSKLSDAKAATENAKATTEEAKQKDINAKISEREAAAIEKAAKAKQKEADAANNLSSRPIESIPFEIKTNTDDIKDVGDVVNELEREQLEAEQAARDWAAAQIDAANSVSESSNLIKDAGENTKKYADNLELLTGTQEENESFLRKQKNELSAVQKELKDTKKFTDESAKGTIAYKNRIAELTSAETRLKGEISELSKTVKNQNVVNNSAAGSIDNLRAKYALLLRQVEQGGAAFQQTSIGKALIAETQTVKTQLDKAERQVLLFRGSLSNVGSAVTGFASKAFSFLRTAANIIPGLGIGGLIFALVDPIIDFTKKLLDAGKAMNVLKESQGLLSEALKDNSYSEAVKNVDELKIQIGLAKDGFLDKDKVLKHYNETIGKTTGEVNSLDEAEKALVDHGEDYIKVTLLKAAANLALSKASAEALKQAQEQQTFNEDLASTTPKKQTTGGVTLQATTAGEGDFSEAQQRILKERQKAKDISDKRIKGFRDIASDFLTEAALISSSLNFDFFGDGKGKGGKDNSEKFFSRTLERFKKYQLDISENEKNGAKVRIDARLKASEIERVIAENSAAIEIKNAKGDTNKILTIRKTLSEDLIDINDKENKDVLKITDDFNKQVINLVKQNFEDRKKINASSELSGDLKKEHEEKIKNLQDDFDLELKLLESSKKEKQEKLSEQFAAGLINERQYQEGKADIEAEFGLKSLQAQLDFAKRLVDIKKSFGFDTKDDEKRLAELQIQLNNAVTDNHIRNNERAKKSDEERFKDLADKIRSYGEIQKNILSAVSEIVSIGFEKQKDRIDQDLEAVQKRREEELRLADAITNTTERTNEIIAVNARADAQASALDRKRRQVQQQQARFERVSNIADIIQRTALAVVTTLGDKTIQPGYLRIPLAVTVGALGLAQLAHAVAAPIPRFAQGGEVKNDGLIMVGDGGKHEGVKLPDGTIMKTPNVNTVMYAEKGTKVFPDYNKMMFKATLTDVPKWSSTKTTDTTPMILLGLKSVERTLERSVKRIPQTQFVVDNIISKKIRQG